MNLDFFTLFITIAILIAMLIPGFVVKKLKMVDVSAAAVLSTILLFCCQPFLTLKSFVFFSEDVTGSIVIAMLIMLGFSIFSQLLIFLVARFLYLKVPEQNKKKIFTFATVFSNSGFIGIPFISMISNNNPYAILFATMYVVSFNMLIWTLGVYIITGDPKQMKPLKAITNPSVAVLAVALPMFFIPEINIFKMNDIVGSFVRYFGEMTTPLSMTIIGIRLADMKLTSVFKGVDHYFVAIVNLILVPLIIFVIFLPLKQIWYFADDTARALIPTILFVMMSIPPAASMIAFCERFKGDTEEAVKVFMSQTLMSIITMPLILMLATL